MDISRPLDGREYLDPLGHSLPLFPAHVATASIYVAKHPDVAGTERLLCSRVADLSADAGIDPAIEQQIDQHLCRLAKALNRRDEILAVCVNGALIVIALIERSRQVFPAGERAMDSDDQSVELIWSELMMPHIPADDARDLREIDPGRRAFDQCVLPHYLQAFFIGL